MVTPSPAPDPLAAPVDALRGIGGERAAQLARLGLLTIGDLLLHRPRRYEDRRHFHPIGRLQEGASAAVRGRIVALGVKRWRARTRSVFELILEDGTGRLFCRWWNMPFMESYFHVGDEVLAYGKVSSLRPRAMDHPETEVVEAGDEVSPHLNRVVPIYPLTEGLNQRWLRTLLWRALEQHGVAIPEPWRLPVPADLLSRAEAVRALHFPREPADAEAGRQRLAFDEFVTLQLELQRRRRQLQARATSLPCAGDNRLLRPFLARLGFRLTAAQARVLHEIRLDLHGPPPMRRLLQGDVGAGKTVVAACSALMALESGCDVALMAPTEILAEQHFALFTHWFSPLQLPVHLRTGSRRLPAGEHLGPPLLRADGAAPAALTIGTHALLEEDLVWDRLGLVIIDEQHRFGVAQREQLVRKGAYPHLLVMTATPIPRTLGLTLYGDLDLSLIDELPGGRGRVRTHVRSADRLPRVWQFVRAQLSAGRQAFVVYPRVEETDLGELKAVTREYEQLVPQMAPFRVGLLHGQLPAAERDRVMAAFRDGQLPLLVTTSVIEVGIDVPNATVMVIENAERFGLAQLHQLRGRIGRGAHESYCILVAGPKSEEAHRRLRVLEETSDGFRVAEEDLRLRGPGEFLGRHQSGRPPFRLADLETDADLLHQARAFARQLLDATASPAG
jgi:ATP-dependent DNA helicase RecG